MNAEELQEWRRQRLASAVETKFEHNRAALGRALGHTDGAFVRQMLTGERPITEKTVAAIEVLPGMHAWFSAPALARYSAEGDVIALGVTETNLWDAVEVLVYDVRFSAGKGRLGDFEIVEASAPAYYPRSWFQRERINPENARRFKVDGDSMEPLLCAGDHVLVDVSDIVVADGRVYALRYGNELRIKRVWRTLDGGLVLRSDNPSYVTETVPAGVAEEHITIIGRVRDRSGSGGL